MKRVCRTRSTTIAIALAIALARTLARTLARALILPVLVVLLLPVTWSVAAAADYVVVVEGLGGNEDYTQAFGDSVAAIEASLNDSTAVTVFAAADATTDAVAHHMTQLAMTLTPTDQFSLMLIGHGNATQQGYRFNVRGADITDAHLVQWLNELPATRQLVVVATSASGGLQKALAAPHRIVVTATKSAQEQNATQFHRYWSQALNDQAADSDRNEIISADEAFEFATQSVASHYRDKNLLATEHAVFTAGTDIVSRRYVINRTGRLASLEDDSQVRGLLVQRDRIEDEFHALLKNRSDNPSWSDDDYYAQLEVVLLKLARLQLDIDAAAGESP